jgi:hypothetical protein
MEKEYNAKEYNELCAEFLGVDINYSKEVYKDSISPLRQYIHNKPKSEELLFDTDWNWIMEVVEKIESSFNGFVLFKIEDESCFVSAISTKNYNNHTEMSTKKEAVVQAIWKFLNWYKDNK